MIVAVIALLILGSIGLILWAWWLDRRAEMDYQGRKRVGK